MVEVPRLVRLAHANEALAPEAAIRGAAMRRARRREGPAGRTSPVRHDERRRR